jgi:transposase
VDLATGAVVAVRLHKANNGDTKTVYGTLNAAAESLRGARDDPEVRAKIPKTFAGEVVADKGYHSNAACRDARAMGVRTYLSEPAHRRRKWRGKRAEREAVYANRRRVRGRRGKALLRKRGELLERPFAHCYETGGMRRTHLRGHPNILKRLLIHVAGFNLGLLMRALTGIGKPRRAQERPVAEVLALLSAILGLCKRLWTRAGRFGGVRRVPAGRPASCAYGLAA